MWNKLANTGITDDLGTFLTKRIRLTNQIVASVTIIAICYIFVFYFSGLRQLGFITILVPVLILVSLLLNHRGWYLAARIWFMLIINGIVLLYCFFLGTVTNIHYVFFSIACMPWLLFEIRDWKFIAIGLCIPITFFYLYIFLDKEALVVVQPTAQKIIGQSITGVIFIVCGLCIGFMSVQNFRSESSMAFANKRQGALLSEIREQKGALESQQEELRQINDELTQQAEALRASEEELRTQEEELRHVNVELEEKSETIAATSKILEIRAIELEAANKYKSEFLANMSHELRTPLNSVLILANLLKENKGENLTPKQIEYARIIHKSGSDLLELINDILDLSKIEAGKTELRFETTLISEIAYDMEQLFTVLANEKKVHFKINLPAGNKQTIITDKGRLEQVLKNLLSNAFKFTPEQGNITLSFEILKDALSIAVRDTGIGIPLEKQQIIFEAFQQADGSTSRRFGGTGLGLSISKELVNRLGGYIEVDSKPGLGSSFIIHLPFHGPAISTTTPFENNEVNLPPLIDFTAVKEQVLIPDSRAEIKAGIQSILIIEDDPVFAQLVNEFALDKGYKTLVAISGDEGLFYAKKYKPAAIILDLGLPVINGRNILKVLKSDDELRHIPVHVITSEDRADFSNWQIEGFVHKPILGNELETTFTSIAKYIGEHYKSILFLLSGNTELKAIVESMAAEGHSGIMYNMVETIQQANEVLEKQGSDCIIVDIGDEITTGIETLRKLKHAAQAHVYIIVCLLGNISSAEEKELKKYANSMIWKSSQAKGRLLDEVELFLHKVNNPSRHDIPEKYLKSYDRSLDGKKVILADDDMRNVFALTSLLEEEGLIVLAAENGKVAIDLLQTNKDIDIILMDIMMPEMDGYEAMRYIRRDMRSQIPIIALTAKAMTGDREKALESGASDYITKPVDHNKLFSLIRVWLA